MKYWKKRDGSWEGFNVCERYHDNGRRNATHPCSISIGMQEINWTIDWEIAPVHLGIEILASISISVIHPPIRIHTGIQGTYPSRVAIRRMA